MSADVRERNELDRTTFGDVDRPPALGSTTTTGGPRREQPRRDGAERVAKGEEHLMANPFDPTLYFRTPRLDAPSAIALGKMLREARPRGLPPPARQAAKRLDESVKALEAAWQGSERGGVRELDVRRFDQRLDNLWSALRGRLVAHGALAEGRPERTRAEAIDAMLFPGGLGFLKAPYVVEHTESQRRLDLIASEGLGDDLRWLVGPIFVEELAAAHADYGRALGITAALSPSPPAPTRVAEPLREMQGALRSYALQLLAHAETGGEASEAVWSALRPIDALRSMAGRRSSRGAAPGPGPIGPADPADPTDPTPAGGGGGEGGGGGAVDEKSGGVGLGQRGGSVSSRRWVTSAGGAVSDRESRGFGRARDANHAAGSRATGSRSNVTPAASSSVRSARMVASSSSERVGSFAR